MTRRGLLWRGVRIGVPGQDLAVRLTSAHRNVHTTREPCSGKCRSRQRNDQNYRAELSSGAKCVNGSGDLHFPCVAELLSQFGCYDKAVPGYTGGSLLGRTRYIALVDNPWMVDALCREGLYHCRMTTSLRLRQSHVMNIVVPDRDVHSRLVRLAKHDGKTIGATLQSLLDLRDAWDQQTTPEHPLGRPAPIPERSST